MTFEGWDDYIPFFAVHIVERYELTIDVTGYPVSVYCVYCAEMRAVDTVCVCAVMSHYQCVSR